MPLPSSDVACTIGQHNGCEFTSDGCQVRHGVGEHPWKGSWGGCLHVRCMLVHAQTAC